MVNLVSWEVMPFWVLTFYSVAGVVTYLIITDKLRLPSLLSYDPQDPNRPNRTGTQTSPEPLLIGLKNRFSFFLSEHLPTPVWRAINRVIGPKRPPYQGRKIELLDAILRGNQEAVEELLVLIKKNKPEFDINSPSGSSTLLCIAARSHRSLYCVRTLIKHGADVNMKDVQGVPPLVHAARNGQHETLRVLLEHGADWNVTDGEDWTPLHWTALNGREECAAILLAKGADPNHPDSCGATPAHCACNSGHASTLSLLIRSGADVTTANKQGDTPLHAAANNGCVFCIPLLVDHGAQLNVKNKNNETPMIRAARRGHKPFVEKIVQLEEEHGGGVHQSLKDLVDLLMCKTFKEEEQLNIQNVVKHIAGIQRGIHLFTICQIICDSIQLQAKDLLTPSDEADNDTTSIAAQGKAFNNTVRTLTELVENLSAGEDGIRGRLTPQWDVSPFAQMMPVWNRMDDILYTLSEELSPNQVNYSLTTSGRLTFAAPPAVSTSAPATSGESLPLQGFSSSSRQLFERLCPVLAGFHRLCASGAEDVLNPPSDRKDQLESQLDLESAGGYINVKRLMNLVTSHKALFVQILSQNLSLLTGSMDFILEHVAEAGIPELKALVRMLAFDQKRSWLKGKLKVEREIAQNANNFPTDVIISRGSILNDSCNSFQSATTDSLKSGLSVRFSDEEGQGAGVQREWFNTLLKEMFNPDNALFISTPQNTFQPNPCSYVNPDHLNYFFFVGQVIALALFHDEVLDVHFTRSFYKHILGIPVSWTDLEAMDPEFYRNLQWILDEHQDDDISALELTFSAEANDFGRVEVVDLKPNGRNISVNSQNKEEYVQLLAEFKITRAIRPQIEHFLAGFQSILPYSLIAPFNEFELELLISGSPVIDVDDWEKNTEYVNFQPKDDQIVWFWKAVRSFTPDQRALLLQFVSGSASVPLGGFGQLRGVEGVTKFTVSKRVDCGPNTLPTASTCFNLLRLPVYPSYEHLVDRFSIAISIGASGFAFA